MEAEGRLLLLMDLVTIACMESDQRQMAATGLGHSSQGLE